MRTPTELAGCVVLAAGGSHRFGSDKRLYQLSQGITLLDQTLANVRDVFERRVLVLRPQDTSLQAQYADDWEIVLAADAAKGMGHSLAAAAPLFAHWPAVVVALADMAWVRPQSYSAVQAALRADALVVPCFKSQRGNPVGIGRDYFDKVAQLQGDSGARQLFTEFKEKLIRLELDDPGILRDMDIRP